MFETGARVREIAVGEEEEKNHQRSENQLQRAVESQGADKHDGGKQTPHRKIRSHRGIVRCRAPSKFRQNDQRDEGKPEQTVGYESSSREPVILLALQESSNY